jgi:hypothetical protein
MQLLAENEDCIQRKYVRLHERRDLALFLLHGRKRGVLLLARAVAGEALVRFLLPHDLLLRLMRPTSLSPPSTRWTFS